jgi:hypothetical protein
MSTFDNSRAGWVAYHAANHPVPICLDFIPKPGPAAFWCATCGWNKPLHSDEEYRAAIAAELERLGFTAKTPAEAVA